MGLDNIKNNPPAGAGVGPAGTPSHGGPHETPGHAASPGGQPDPARGRANNPDKPARARGNGNEQNPRVQEVINEGKQKVRQLLDRAVEAPGGRTRVEDHAPPGQAKKQADGGQTQWHDTGPHTRASDGGGHGRSDFRPAPGNGEGNGPGNSRGLGAEAHNLSHDTRGGLNVPSVVAYLRGDPGGGRVPRELRQALDGASKLLGSDLLAALERRGASGDGGHAVKFVEHALARVARTLERVAEAGGSAGAGVAPRVLKEAVAELAQATMLDRYFRRAEKTAGRVASQAEAALARLLYGGRRGEGEGGFESPRRARAEMPAPHPLEVLRDLEAGAFRPAEVARGPFPLNGRALVATEMMELMRTLDALERLTRELAAAAQKGGAPGAFVAGEPEEAPLLALIRTLAGAPGGAEMIDELLAVLTPTLPGRAGRLEIPRFVAALGGVLVDAEGRAFVTKEGVALKLDRLMWLGSLGGVLKSVAGAGAESFPVRLSPLLIYGFDAVYSLIGFDGRTLNPPHFAAVQAQVNGSELEWVFGQPPLSEGWVRALIERLKDSAEAEHNLLGEMLEEALAEGRFHAALVAGTVSEGEARPDTFTVTRLLPATA
ncbi:MAG TPA: hypothetical protein VF736_13385 [Pyrinomonadaceae bacterium]|jgi:hypothetical protein